MDQETSSHPASNNELSRRFELLRWTVEKQEALRTNNITRARVLATAASIVIAAYTAVLSRPLQLLGSFGRGGVAQPYVIVDLLALVGFGLTLGALFYALDSFLHLRRRSQDLGGYVFPDRPPFHSIETVEKYKEFDPFFEDLRDAPDMQLFRALAADLWVIHSIHAVKTESLRKSGWLLVASVVFLLTLFTAVATLRI